jgi:hypothetical protein
MYECIFHLVPGTNIDEVLIVLAEVLAARASRVCRLPDRQSHCQEDEEQSAKTKEEEEAQHFYYSSRLIPPPPSGLFSGLWMDEAGEK